MSYRYFLNSPMSMIERRMNIIIAKNPQLINLLHISKNHPLVKKYSKVLFNN